MEATLPKYRPPHLHDLCELIAMLDIGVVIGTAGSSRFGHLNRGWSR